MELIYTLPGPADHYVAGIRVSPTGQTYATVTESPSDVFLAGRRISAIGQLVVAGVVP